MVYEIGNQQRKESTIEKVAYKIPHDLACDISPTNQDASRAHRASVICTWARTHEPLTALVRPRHYISHGLCALSKTIHQAPEFDLQQLNEIFVPAVADECRLVPNGLEVDPFPRTAHLGKLLLIGEDCIQGLGNLVDVEESHWHKLTVKRKSGSQHATYRQDGQNELPTRL
jgi:hypothetical protein